MKTRSAVSTKPKQKKPSILKRAQFKAKTLGCGALKLTDFTSLDEQMKKYVIAEQVHDKAKMEKAKKKWKLIRKCQIDRINKTQKKQIKYDDGNTCLPFTQHSFDPAYTQHQSTLPYTQHQHVLRYTQHQSTLI